MSVTRPVFVERGTVISVAYARDVRQKRVEPNVDRELGIEWNFFFSSRRRHTSLTCDWSSDVCSSDLERCGRHRGEFGDRPLRERAQDRRAFLLGKGLLDVRAQARQSPDGIAVLRAKALLELANNPRRKRRRVAAGIDADRQIADTQRCGHAEVPASDVRCIGGKNARIAGIGQYLRVDLGIVGCGNDEGCVRQIFARVTAPSELAAVCREERAQAFLDSRRYHENGESRAGKRFGFACGDVASADDYGATTVRPKRDGEHTNAKRVPHPAVKSRLSCCACKPRRDRFWRPRWVPWSRAS